MARPKPRRWIRIRSPRVIAAERRAHVREVRDYARGRLTLTTASPKMISLYGRVFPPAEAARQAARRTDWFDNRVMDRHAGIYRDRAVRRKTPLWGFGSAKSVKTVGVSRKRRRR